MIKWLRKRIFGGHTYLDKFENDPSYKDAQKRTKNRQKRKKKRRK